MKDAIKKGTRQAIETCHKAGINVRMVTVDNIVTATAIALDAGIITEADIDDPEEHKIVCTDGFICKTESRFEETLKECLNEDGTKGTTTEEKFFCNIVDMDAFRKIEKKLKVSARSNPGKGNLLIDGLLHIGRTVAVSNDGSNDDPALNRSAVGFTTGISGSDF